MQEQSTAATMAKMKKTLTKI